MAFASAAVIRVTLDLGDLYRALWEAQWHILTGRTWYASRPAR